MSVSMGIHDGRTKELRAIQENVESLAADANRTFHIDDFIYQGNKLNGILNECLKKWKEFPKNRYLINVLCLLFFYSCTEESLQKLFEEQEGKKPLSESSEKILADLTDHLVGRIGEIGDDAIRRELEETYTPDVIRDNLMDLKEDFFLEFLAPICDMDAESVDVFLLRAFRRDQLSNYRTNEYLLGQAMDLFGQGIDESTIEILYKLRACYASVSPAPVAETISGAGGSRRIAEKGRIVLEYSGGVFRPEDHPQIQEKLGWYKAAVRPAGRDRKAAYKALFDETFRLYADEMDDFLRVIRPMEKKRAKLRHREEFSVPVMLWYDNSGGQKEVGIRAGTKFSGKNCVYELMERVALPPEDYVPVCIHVAPHPDNAGKEKKGNAVPEGAVFQIISGDVQKNGKPVIKNVRTVSIKSVDTEKTENLSPGMTVNTSLWSRPKWRPEDCKKANGFVLMDVMVGETIPRDLCLAYNGFKFIPLDGTDTPYYSRKTVTAQLDLSLMPFKNAKLENSKNIYVLDDTYSITVMKPCPDVVVRVSNLKNRAVVPQDKFDAEHFKQTRELILKDFENAPEDTDVSFAAPLPVRKRTYSDDEVFRRYMYGQEDYEIVSNLDIELSEKIGFDRNSLSSGWLLDSRVLGDMRWFAKLSEYRQRSVILVLLFLQYIKKSSRTAAEDRERFIRGFRVFAGEKMDGFRFDGLYLGYPLDCLLMFLLGACVPEDLCDTLRVICKENERQEGAFENGE